MWLIITKKLNIPKVKAKNVYNKQIHAECRYKSYIKHDKSKVLFAYWGIQHVLTIWVTWRISYKRQELLTLRDGFTPAPCCLPFVMGSPLLHVAYPSWWVHPCSMLLIFLVFCVVFFVLFFFVLYLVYQMLPVSLGCFCFVFLCPVSCVPNVASVSGLFLFCFSLSCILCTKCCQCLWVVFCFVFLCPISCVPNVASVSGLSILDCPFDFL